MLLRPNVSLVLFGLASADRSSTKPPVVSARESAGHGAAFADVKIEIVRAKSYVGDPAACGDNPKPQNYGNESSRASRERRNGIVFPLANALVSDGVEYKCIEPGDYNQQHLDLESRIVVHLRGFGGKQQDPGGQLNDETDPGPGQILPRHFGDRLFAKRPAHQPQIEDGSSAHKNNDAENMNRFDDGKKPRGLPNGCPQARLLQPLTNRKNEMHFPGPHCESNKLLPPNPHLRESACFPLRLSARPFLCVEGPASWMPGVPAAFRPE